MKVWVVIKYGVEMNSQKNLKIHFEMNVWYSSGLHTYIIYLYTQGHITISRTKEIIMSEKTLRNPFPADVMKLNKLESRQDLT